LCTLINSKAALWAIFVHLHEWHGVVDKNNEVMPL